ncbi:MAG: ABC transporter substrate-binding protein [Bacteroidetes bacterium]|nr:ABC transporter substrate-binding protein [Bacteroidota bacterium]
MLRFISQRTLMAASLLLVFAGLVGLLPSCSHRSEGPVWTNPTVVVGISSPVNAFNPIFAPDATTAEINELLYPMLVSSTFDTVSGTLVYAPALARSWEKGRGGRDIVFHLRSDARWADGKPVRASDVQFTFELYADPEVGSRWQDVMENLERERDGSLVVKRAVVVRNDSTVVFRFKRVYASQLFDAGVPILPAHIFSRIPKPDLETHPVNQQPMAAGPFVVAPQSTSQEIILVPNQTSSLPYPARLERLVFRTVPEYRTRVLQLRSGEIDMMSALELDDIRAIQRDNPQIQILTLPPRRLHFVGWNTIEPISWTGEGLKTLRPHPLFGSAKVRRALTMAINRTDIARSLLGPFALPAVGPVAPIFSWAQNEALRPVPYDPRAAAALLEAEGWKDRDGDGILDKDGKPFAFVLRVQSGVTLWADIATVIQQQLRAVKIEAIIQQAERPVFWSDLINKKYDAWVAGFEVPLEVRLDDMWHSDLETHPLNIASYRNPEVDKLLQRVRSVTNQPLAARDLKAIQSILAADQPFTFLFWERGRIAVNRRVANVHANVMAMTSDAWDWQVIPGR